MTLRLLDLFCGAGGAAMGYHRAGFEVIGVDIEPQPRYPFEFVQADALDVLDGLYDSERAPVLLGAHEAARDVEQGVVDHVGQLGGAAVAVNGDGDVVNSHESHHDMPALQVKSFDAIHASPPCQAYSAMTACRPGLAARYPALIEPVRERLEATGLSYVIENVRGAPLKNPALLTGAMFDLPLKRDRMFETSWTLPLILAAHHDRPVSRAGHWRPGTLISVGGNCSPIALARDAMGIDWMTRDELAEAIPPAYTEWVGAQLLEHLFTQCPDRHRYPDERKGTT